MAYNDPYGRHNYGHNTTQQFHDNVDAYNPYDNAQPHETYDQGGYGYHDTGYGGGYSDDPNVAAGASKERERNVFEDETAAARALGPK